MERIYDSNRRIHGYVRRNTIYDNAHNVRGYINGSMVYDANYIPVAYLENGTVYNSGIGAPVGYYRRYNLYDMNGRYLGYGNHGWAGLLGAALLLGAFTGWGWW